LNEIGKTVEFCQNNFFKQTADEERSWEASRRCWRWIPGAVSHSVQWLRQLWVQLWRSSRVAVSSSIHTAIILRTM